MRILIAEDDPQLRSWLLRAIGILGHDAEAVGDAETLVLRAEGFTPDAVLSDIGLPGCDGIAAGLWLRRTSPRCRIILMSGSHDHAEAAHEAGFTAVLDKPFTLEELEAALSKT
jgi:DNA-binding response OmpR family regulator